MNEILFYNFASENLDTIVIKKFIKGTGFSTLLDSITNIRENHSSGLDHESVFLQENIVVVFDYKIELISTGQVFTITDFAVKKKRCNTGPFCNDHFNSLESYKINGQYGGNGMLAIHN